MEKLSVEELEELRENLLEKSQETLPDIIVKNSIRGE